MRRLILLITVLFACTMAVGVLWYYHSLWGVHSERIVELDIIEGSTARDILAQLHSHELIPSVLAARIYLKTWHSGDALYYGHYRFPRSSRPVDILKAILAGQVEMFSVTIVEGSEVSEIGEQLAALGLGTRHEWRDFGLRTEWIEDLASDATSLEGFFFPDTYRFAVGISAERVARHLVERFREVWSDEIGTTKELWGSTLEIVTLASLVEAETSLDEERPLIAGVFANRLRRGMLLQCDPTVIYALKRRGEWNGRLLRIHWEIDDPYNTYRKPGLPPGPINNPGRAALEAAIHPQTTPYLYFVARPGGGHVFSKTLAEHNQAVARLRSSRR